MRLSAWSALAFAALALPALAQEGVIGSGVRGGVKPPSLLSAPLYVAMDNAVLSTSTTQYVPLGQAGQSTTSNMTTASSVAAPLPTPGTISNLCAEATTAITTGSYAVSLYTGGPTGPTSLTPLTVTLDPTHQVACDTVHSVAVASAGNQVNVGQVPTGTPTSTKFRASVEFTSTVGQEAPVCAPQTVAIGALGDSVGFQNIAPDVAVGSESTVSMLLPTAGTIDNLYVKFPGTNTITATVYKNGAATSLQAAVASAPNGSDVNPAHGFHVVAGDTISINYANGGGGTAAIFNACVRWRPDTPGEYPVTGVAFTGFATNATRYAPVGSIGAGPGVTTEIVMGVVPVAHTLKNLRLSAASAQGASQSWAMTLRTGAVPGSAQANTALTETLSNATSGQCACSAAIGQGQLADYMSVMSATAAASPNKWAATATIP